MVDKQLQIMVRESATPPSDRLNKIKEVIRNVSIRNFIRRVLSKLTILQIIIKKFLCYSLRCVKIKNNVCFSDELLKK